MSSARSCAAVVAVPSATVTVRSIVGEPFGGIVGFELGPLSEAVPGDAFDLEEVPF